MCGRARQFREAGALAAAASAVTGAPTVAWVDRDAYKPQENFHPGCDAAVLIAQRRRSASCPASEIPVAFRTLGWGLVPPAAAAKTSPSKPKSSPSKAASPKAKAKESSTPPTDSAPNHWKMFNARSETVDTLGVFKRLLGRGRCVMPLDGFYEWADDEFKSQVRG